MRPQIQTRTRTRTWVAFAFLSLLGITFAQETEPDSLTGVFSLPQFPTQNLPLNAFFNNIAASPDGSADFNGKGESFDSKYLPTGKWEYDAITYDFPSTWGTEPDNAIANGQVLSLDPPTYVQELHMVYSGDAGNSTHEFVQNFVLTFTDNSTQTLQLYARNWWRWPILNHGVIRTPYHFDCSGTCKNHNVSHIFQWSSSVYSEYPLKSVTLPLLTSNSRRLHLWSMLVSPCIVPPTPEAVTVDGSVNGVDGAAAASDTNVMANNTPSPYAHISIRRARFTNRWETVNGGIRTQVVEVTLANLAPESYLPLPTQPVAYLNSPHSISLTGDGITTLLPGVIYRLVPGDQVSVDVLVIGTRGVGAATVLVRGEKGGKVVGKSGGWKTSKLRTYWEADRDVLAEHETPKWWNNAKFGIFIHWGIYSVPAWAPSSNYAESYTWFLHTPPNASSLTWAHHLETYGTDVLYDSFIANFTASKFSASEWLDLFDDAGARYFVFVTKHHDGYSLFDTGDTTHRSSVHLGPKRDFTAELLSAAKTEKPHIHRGVYYSLPEWFSPDSQKYGFGVWPGGIPNNPFNESEKEVYTGRVEIGDYIDDLQYPHMLDLGTRYDAEIMWCDIGGPNRTVEFAAEFYNDAWREGRQVTINNRCGEVPDFDTPEYATFGAIQTRKWESSEGMDPHSYGYNSATADSAYKNGTTIVKAIVDIASKNGNYLLDVGPTAEGEIIEPMRRGLLDAGAWLKYSGECVYDTRFWFPGSMDKITNPPSRFLTTPTTFCFISWTAPVGDQIVVNKRLPILPGDSIHLLNPDGLGASLPWTVDNATGQLTVNVSSQDTTLVQHAWAFQVKYKTD